MGLFSGPPREGRVARVPTDKARLRPHRLRCLTKSLALLGGSQNSHQTIQIDILNLQCNLAYQALFHT